MLASSSKKPVAGPKMPPSYPPTKGEEAEKGGRGGAKPKAPKRDEWKLVPPTSSVLGSATCALAKLSTDNALWTEMPTDRQQRRADEVSGKKRRAANTRRRGAAPGIEEHTRQTRGSALVDMHTRAGKDKDDGDEKKGIWDRDRDMALNGRFMDDDKRNTMLKEAKGLEDRLGTWETGGFY
ncbi:hypothetical protein C8R43DRAFT_1142368 [Mycena crocata]|nr:hypothetical protein C8R43DRAFT_1142368 [Mycena crocata]